MKIEIEAKRLKNYLEDVYLKGKYYDGASSKNGILSDYAMMSVEDTGELRIANASPSVACRIDHHFTDEQDVSQGACIIDIANVLKHLKVFSGDMTFTCNDHIVMTDSTKKASLSKALTHPHMDMINRILEYDLGPLSRSQRAGQLGMVQFGRTQFDSMVTLLEDDAVDAAKACDALNLARYKFDFTSGDVLPNSNPRDTKLTISSQKTEVDRVEVSVDMVNADGVDSTVEFTGPFSGFVSGLVSVFLKDDSPVMFYSPNRLLIKAPYLSR